MDIIINSISVYSIKKHKNKNFNGYYNKKYFCILHRTLASNILLHLVFFFVVVIFCSSFNCLRTDDYNIFIDLYILNSLNLQSVFLVLGWDCTIPVYLNRTVYWSYIRTVYWSFIYIPVQNSILEFYIYIPEQNSILEFYICILVQNSKL